MAERPAKAVQTVLAAALTGVTVRVGRPQDTPDKGVWVVATGGYAPIPICGADEDLRRPTVQVYVREAKGNAEALETLVWQALNAINRTPPTDYASALPASDPIDLQPDENGRPRASFNVELVIIE